MEWSYCQVKSIGHVESVFCLAVGARTLSGHAVWQQRLSGTLLLEVNPDPSKSKGSGTRLEGLLQIVALGSLIIEDGEGRLGWLGAAVAGGDDNGSEGRLRSGGRNFLPS